MNTEPSEIQDDRTESAGAASPQPPAPDSRDPAEVIAEFQAKVDSLEDSLLRARADFQNFQRRSATERSEAIRYANAELMKSLLGVLDDFERALAAAKTPETLPAVVEGVRLVYKNLAKALSDFGLEPIDAQRQPFDPSIHEALLHQPTAEAAAGMVLEQVAKGYKLRDRVLRPARVVVAKSPEANG